MLKLLDAKAGIIIFTGTNFLSKTQLVNEKSTAFDLSLPIVYCSRIFVSVYHQHNFEPLQYQSLRTFLETALMELCLCLLHSQGSYSAYGQPLQVLPVFDFVEHKPCPYNGDFTASVAKGELFLMEKSASPTSGRLLTGQLLTHVGKDEKKHISAGQPSFCTMVSH